MIQSGNVFERHAIPRWNNIETAVELGELSPIDCKKQGSTDHHDINFHLESLLTEWKFEPSLPVAIEIISSANLSDGSIDICAVKDYALHATKNMEHIPPLLADALDLTNTETDNALLGTTNPTYLPISKLKRSLCEYPRNPFNWYELARQYLIVGQINRSERSLQIALSLAPNNRTILRAIAHFYSHINDPEKGLYYLRKSPITRHDPWVLSSEIALSNELQRTSKLVKHGLQVIESTNCSPVSLSELASELGTMDFISGNNKKGRKKLEIAKKAPHENSVAQMTWINQRLCNIEPIIQSTAEPKYNYEAEAKWDIAQKNWSAALNTICKWQEYQPFSRGPAMEGSYIAMDFLDNPKKAITILEQGMLSNPNDIALENNYIYSLIMDGNLDLASKRLNQFNISPTATDDQISLIATYGLFFYRSGCPDMGKPYYQSAIEQAIRLNQLETAYRATIYLAREEKRAGYDIGNYLSTIHNDKNKAFYLEHLPLIEKFGLE